MRHGYGYIPFQCYTRRMAKAIFPVSQAEHLSKACDYTPSECTPAKSCHMLRSISDIRVMGAAAFTISKL